MDYLMVYQEGPKVYQQEISFGDARGFYNA